MGTQIPFYPIRMRIFVAEERKLRKHIPPWHASKISSLRQQPAEDANTSNLRLPIRLLMKNVHPSIGTLDEFGSFHTTGRQRR